MLWIFLYMHPMQRVFSIKTRQVLTMCSLGMLEMHWRFRWVLTLQGGWFRSSWEIVPSMSLSVSHLYCNYFWGTTFLQLWLMSRTLLHFRRITLWVNLWWFEGPITQMWQRNGNRVRWMWRWMQCDVKFHMPKKHTEWKSLFVQRENWFITGFFRWNICAESIHSGSESETTFAHFHHDVG